jgi:hypothetical protein
MAMFVFVVSTTDPPHLYPNGHVGTGFGQTSHELKPCTQAPQVMQNTGHVFQNYADFKFMKRCVIYFDLMILTVRLLQRFVLI